MPLPNCRVGCTVSTQLATKNRKTRPSPLQNPTGHPAFEDRIFFESNSRTLQLYYIDPEDKEILQELREVRLQTIQLMLSVGRDELGRQFQSDFG